MGIAAVGLRVAGVVAEGSTIPMASANPLRGVLGGRAPPLSGDGVGNKVLLPLLLLLLLLLQVALGDMRVKNSPSRSIHEV